MNRVLVERPRFNSRNNNDQKGDNKRQQKLDKNNYEDAPQRTSTSRGKRFEQKELNEHLAPLRRFLKTNCGRPWNKVYSEIRENISPNNAVQMHIMQHLFQYVCLDAIEVEHNIFADGKGESIYDPFFVHPRTKLLTENMESFWHKGSSYKPTPQEPKYIKQGDRNYRQFNDIWYDVKLENLSPMPKGSYWKFLNDFSNPPKYDVVFGGHITYGEAKDLHGEYVYAISKRQIGKKEIQKNNLRENPNQLPNIVRKHK